MTIDHHPAPHLAALTDVVPAAVTRARGWLAAAGTGGRAGSGANRAERRSTARLAAVMRDPAGVEFTMRFVDTVARPEDDAVAAAELARLARPGDGTTLPGFVGPVERVLLGLGARFVPLAPRLLMPLVRRRLRDLVGHLVADAGDRALTRTLAGARASGVQLNLNLLGEAVLGQQEAARRLRRTLELIRRDDVDYVSIKASSVVAQLEPWDVDGDRERLVATLLPLYRAALEHGVFVNLDMEEYRDLDLTLAVFSTLMGLPELRRLQAGIVLQAYLPDSHPAVLRLAELARQRAASGAAPIKVRLVKGANLAMELLEAELHDWPQAPYTTKADVDANYVRILDAVLRPELAGCLRLGAASHNLFDVALAHELASARGVSGQLDVEMLRGMAPAQAAAVKADVGALVLYTPVAHAGDFDVAISYLVRRLEELAAPQNYLHALFAAEEARAAAMHEQELRFLASVQDSATVGAEPRRTQDRSAGAVDVQAGPFRNVADTDPALPANRRWALAALAEAPALTTAAEELSADDVDEVVAVAVAASAGWSARPATDRAAVLRACAAELARARGDLLRVMAHEAGKTVAEADPEISEAIDFAAYYADRAPELERPGTTFTPDRVVVVTPPWNFPVAIPLGGVLAALAAGASVIIKPAPQARACAEVGVAALHAALRTAGVPRDVLQLAHTGEGEAGRRLVTHPGVDTVVLTGSAETAALFRSWQPRLHLLAETSGKNALVITPSADPDLAVADLLRSAFGHAGQKCSAASLAICVGSVATSARFRRQLVDAVRSLRVGPATDPGTAMGPLIEPPGEKLLRALTTLEPGESWLVEPRRLSADGRLWSPGVKEGVRPGSFFATTEVFGPVLGLMAAADLDEAISWQNATAFGLTGGLHSLDPAEIEHWTERVEVGNAYINRHITGAIVQRQSFGGWKGSAIGPGAKAGGPNYVAQFGTWTDAPAETEARRRADDDAWLAAAAADDEAQWATEFALEHDPSGLDVESNVFRYRPLPLLLVRTGLETRTRDLRRVLLAAERAGTPVVVSTPQSEDDDAFAARVAACPAVRIRALTLLPDAVLRAAAQVGASVLDRPVVASGRVELVTVLREQVISRTRHRYGHIPTRAGEGTRTLTPEGTGT